MIINYISDAELPSESANSVQIIKMCNAFIENKNEVILYGKTGDTDKLISNYYDINPTLKIVTSDFTNLKLVGSIKLAIDIAQLVKKNNNADLLFGRYSYGLFLLKNSGIPIIYEAHMLPTRKIHKFMETKIFKSENFKLLIVISNELKKDYLKAFPFLKSESIKVAHDGAEIRDLQKNGSIQKDYQIEKEIGYVGSLYPGKGMEIILELASRLPDFNFHIVGGKDSDIRYWKNKGYNYKNLVFHGFVPNKLLYQYYNKFSIVLAPYKDEVKSRGGNNIEKWMSPLKIFEYMSYEKAIIASNLNTIQEVLVDKENSLICSPNRIDEWINAIYLLSSNKILRNKLAKNGYNDLEKYYTWKIRAKNVLEN